MTRARKGNFSNSGEKIALAPAWKGIQPREQGITTVHNQSDGTWTDARGKGGGTAALGNSVRKIKGYKRKVKDGQPHQAQEEKKKH